MHVTGASQHMERPQARRGTISLQKRSPVAKESQNTQATSKLFTPNAGIRKNQASALKATIQPLSGFDHKSTVIIEGFPQRTPLIKCVDLMSLAGPVVSATELNIPSADAVFLVTFATREAASAALGGPVQIEVQGTLKTLNLRLADEPATLIGNIMNMIGLTS